jgi:PAS domain-containing protein
MESQENVECTYRIVCKGGEIRYVHESDVLVHDACGQAIGWEGIVVDTTDLADKP